MFLTGLLLLTAGIPVEAAPAEPPALGARVADFRLPDVEGHPQQLSALKGKKATVIVFIGTACPISNLYVVTLGAMHKQYADKGVQVLGINANDQDTLEEVIAHARERKIPFPVLKDAHQEAADALGAKRTPEAVLLDGDGVLRYRGRIDDQYGYAYRKAAPKQTELKDALDQVLAGKPVATPTAPVTGCLIDRETPAAKRPGPK